MSAIDPASQGQTDTPAPTPKEAAGFWESRTAEELKDALERGFAGGEAFAAAAAETERRAREAVRRARETAPSENGRIGRKAWLLLLAAIMLAAIAGIVVFLFVG